MKRYIKTSSGIYENKKYWKRPPIEIMNINEVIICEADTIEELCDEYVMVSDLEKKPYVTKGGYKGICEAFEHIKECGRKAIFYGAIWVFDDNGAPTLNPVAKMNEEGELELI